MIKVASLFSQILHHFPRSEFASLVKKHRAERHAKGFTSWAQFVAMIFCHFAAAESLREITGGLQCCLGKLKHLGVLRPVTRSTLAYANQHRPAQLFQDLFYATFRHFLAHGGFGRHKNKFRFKNPLLSLDATTISLCLSLFPWAKFRRAKGGVKVNVLLDHDCYLPTFVRISPAREHEIKTARLLNLNPGSIIAMDKAFNDYQLFANWTEKGVYFVTRLKDNADYRVVQNLPVPQNRHIISDKIIKLTGVQAEQKCPHLLRRIVVWDEEHLREIILLTNHLDFGPTTIAAIYKERWQIELFFKALKQNLKIKTFVGTSENALHIQIWTALIALLVLRWLHHLARAGWSFANCAYLFRLNLFTYRDLTDWLQDPLATEPLIPGPIQLALPNLCLGQLPLATPRGTST
jgi:hypothetical protein